MEIKSIAFEATPRVRRLREEIFQARPKVCAERAVIVTRAYQQTEELPPLLRRAYALDAIMTGISCPIYADELIVGQYGSERRSCPVFPEMSVEWLEKELDTLPTRENDKLEV